MSGRKNVLVARRKVLQGLGIATGVALAGSSSRKAEARPMGAPSPTPSAPVAPLSAEVQAFFGPLQPGSSVDRWQIVAIRGVQMGAIAVVMATAAGARFQLDVLRRDRAAGAPAGVGNSPSLSVFVSNRAQGNTATDEEQGLGAMALADALAQRESEGATVPALLTLGERTARFPRAVFDALA
jgi:hypothetical protein